MSEQQIPPPGPERNALLAERVFGWERTTSKYSWWIPLRGCTLNGPPEWSTNDALSLDVLKAMEGKGYGWEILRDRQGSSAVVRFWQGFRMCGSNLADTLADAITGAAILALAVQP